jgi:ketosteroid isomerase-like protein
MYFTFLLPSSPGCRSRPGGFYICGDSTPPFFEEIEMPYTTDETQIREIIETRAAVLKTGDVDTMVSYYAPEVVEFSLAPPLQQQTDARDPEPLRRWLATFEVPPTREVTRLSITAGPEVAFATSIECLSGTPKGMTESFQLWHRVTLGLRKIDGRWLITHEHQSVPFEMDGSFRASVGLQP